MAKRSEEWKKYLKDVKIRINENRLKTNTNEEIYFLNNEKLSNEELEKINNKAHEVVSSQNFIPDPLGAITNKKVYDNLSDQKKIKYILDLSTIYLTLKAKYRK